MKVTTVFFDRSKQRNNVIKDIENLNKKSRLKLKLSKTDNNVSKLNVFQKDNIKKDCFISRQDILKKSKISIKEKLTKFKEIYMPKTSNSFNVDVFKQLFSINIKSYIIFTISLIVCVNIFSYFNIDVKILNLATNIHQQQVVDFDYAMIKNIYPVFNEKEITSLDVADNTDLNTSNIIFDASIDIDMQYIDSLALKESGVTVFNNSNDIPITSSVLSNRVQINIGDIVINNYSSHYTEIDFKTCLASTINFAKSNDKILLYSTHTSESYTNSEGYSFGYSGTYRSQDANYNVLKTGKMLEENLLENNIKVIHDTTPHDYATYNSSYSRSRITIENAIKSHSGFSTIIDVHRDASADLNFAPKVKIGDVEVAQLMFVVGIGTSSNMNPYANNNIALATKIQLLAEEIYPGLFRPMIIRDSTYNQDMNKYSLLLECGATGNTFQEVEYAMRCFSNLLNLIYLD